MRRARKWSAAGGPLVYERRRVPGRFEGSLLRGNGGAFRGKHLLSPPNVSTVRGDREELFMLCRSNGPLRVGLSWKGLSAARSALRFMGRGRSSGVHPSSG